MENQRTNSEQEIINAAKEVFIEKGYKGTTMRDIASRAGITLSMVNYYFRSKDRLFDIIFEETFSMMYSRLIHNIDSQISLFDMIEQFTCQLIDILTENPSIPNFLFAEVSQNPERLINKIKGTKELLALGMSLTQKIDYEVSIGRIRPITVVDLFINIEALCVFPFVARPILEQVTLLCDIDYARMLEQRKSSVTSFIIDAIKA